MPFVGQPDHQNNSTSSSSWLLQWEFGITTIGGVHEILGIFNS